MRENCLYILPDVHGRVFWKEAVKEISTFNEQYTKDGDTRERLSNKIIFLGDYLDPYQYEGINEQEAIVNFEEIIDFKKKYPLDVILLLGNHDFGYIYPSVNSCRRSKEFFNDIRNMFISNIKLFDITYTYKTKNKKYLFSHAGVHKYWLDNFTKSIDVEYSVENFPLIINNTFHNEHYEDVFVEFIGQYSYFRGYTDHACGSCVWADVREWGFDLGNDVKNTELGYYQIFGHTQLEVSPIIQDIFACIDVRRYFILTDDDKLIDPQYPLGEWEWDLNNVKKKE